MILHFSKYEGLGNDFLVLLQDQSSALSPAALGKLCDRHFAVGGDGVLVTGLTAGEPFMRVINADGSEPEMCGNGLRCVALFLARQGLVSGSEFEIQTAAGPHRVWLTDVGPPEAGPVLDARVAAAQGLSDGVRRALGPWSGGRSAQVRVAMRPASLDAAELLHDARGAWIERPFAVAERELHITAVSMGNPHAVVFDEVAAEDMALLGPRIERDPRFRTGANVGFARMRGPAALSLTVWERGVGFTLACGTGACAAAVAAVETGRSPRGQELEVYLPGGALRIRVGEPGAPIEMAGPARHVFDGQVELEVEG